MRNNEMLSWVASIIVLGACSGNASLGGHTTEVGGSSSSIGGQSNSGGNSTYATGGFTNWNSIGGAPATGGKSSTGGKSASTGGSSGTSTPCGSATCGSGEYCCNPSCSICAPLNGGGCITMACSGTGGRSSTGGASGTGGATSIAGLHSTCVNGTCANASLTPITFYGVAGTSGPQFCMCEIPCISTACPTGMKCTSISDGPGSICAFTDAGGNAIWP